MNHANEEVVRELARYLKTNIPELKNVVDEWPEHNQVLNMPHATILTVGTPSYTPQMPVLQSHIDGISQYIVGYYDLNLSIDIWSDNKYQRGEMMEKVLDVFNKQFQESDQALGISLSLSEYYGVIARYDINGYNYVDGEESSQRDEWRVRLNAVVNFSRIITKQESKMEEVSISHDIADNNDMSDPNNDTDNEEIKTVF